jgi:hypothetical protein
MRGHFLPRGQYAPEYRTGLGQDVSSVDEIGIALVIAGDTAKHLSLAVSRLRRSSLPQAGHVREVPRGWARGARQDRRWPTRAFSGKNPEQSQHEQAAFDRGNWRRSSVCLPRTGRSHIRRHRSRIRSSAEYSARPARPPTSAPLKRMNCKSLPTLISINLTS